MLLPGFRPSDGRKTFSAQRDGLYGGGDMQKRKVFWTILSTGLLVAAAMAARKTAAKAWAIGTGEQPPSKF